MKIKNLNTYIANKVNWENKDIWNFKSQKYGFFEKLNGEISGFHDIKSYVENLTAFANDSYDQIFFELLQNAKDENASEFYIYYEKNGGILILNNGNSFTSDPENKERGKDQFHSFLTKDKSPKAGLDGKSGKYGKGSKLLYNLLIPRDDIDGNTKKSGERLFSSMYDDMQAPIIFSWKDRKLKELLKIANVESFTKDEDLSEKGSSLLCMLLLSYFPLMPNQKVNFYNGEITPFSNDVYIKFISFLARAKDTFDSESLFLDKGTLIYIPAPVSVIEEIVKVENDIINGLEQSFTILCTKGETSNISKIYFNERKINKKEVYSYGFKVKSNDNIHNVELVFSKHLSNVETSMSNIMTDYFPVSYEKYGLAYSIKCEDFDIQENRQKLKNSNIKIFKYISKAIKENIELWACNEDIRYRDKYISLIKALAISEPIVGIEDSNNILDVHTCMLDIMYNYIPDNKGNLRKVTELVFLPKGYEDSSILQDLNLGLYGISPELYEHFRYLKEWGIEVYTISKILSSANDMSVNHFFNGISSLNRLRILKSLNNDDSELLIDIPFIKTSKDNYLSISDFISNEATFLCFPQNIFLGVKDVFQSISILTNTNNINCEYFEKEEYPNIYKVINDNWTSNIIGKRLKEIFSEDNNHFFSANIELVSGLNSLNDESIDKIVRYELFLFRNNNNDLKVLNKILPISDYAFLSQWSISSNDNCNVLHVFFADEEDWWDIISSDKELLERIIRDSNDQSSTINDCCEIFKKSSYAEFNKSLNILKDTDGEFHAIEDFFVTKKMSDFNESEYNSLVKLIENTSYKAIDYSLLNVVCEYLPIFGGLGRSSISKPNKLDISTFIVDYKDVKILYSYCKKTEVNFFANFILKQEDNNNIISSKLNVNQYTTNNQEIRSYLDEKGHYVSLPTDLNLLFKGDKALKSTENDDFIRELVNEYGSIKEFIPLIESSNDTVKDLYISKFGYLSLSSSTEYSRDCFEYKFLRLCTSREKSVDFTRKIIRIDDESLDSNVYNDEVNVYDKCFSLSVLLSGSYPDAKEISKLSKCFIGINRIDEIFRISDIYEDKVYSEIKHNGIENEEQLYFMSLCAEKNNVNLKYVDIVKSLSKTQCLQFFYDKEILFVKFFEFNDLQLNNQIYSGKNNLLLVKERLPIWVNEWVNEYEESHLKFLKDNDLRDDSCELIKLRDVLFRDSDERILHLIRKNDLEVHSEWLLEKNWNISNDSNRIKKCYELSIATIEQLQDISYGLVLEDVISNAEYTTHYIQVDDSFYYYRPFLNDRYIMDLANHSDAMSIDVFLIKDSISNKLFANKKVKFKLEISNPDAIEKKEWSYDYYNKWITEREEGDIRIFSTNQSVDNLYTVTYGEKIFTLANNSGDVGRTGKTEILINKTLLDRSQSELSVLNMNVEILFPGNKDKEQLLSLMLYANTYKDEQVDILKKFNIQSSEDLEKLIQKAKDSVTNGSGNVNSSINQKVLDQLDDLAGDMDNIDIDFLRDFIKNPEKYRLEDEGDKNEVVGYIGEALFYYWINNIMDAEVDWVARKGVAEYDFLVGRDKFIDVKTNKKGIQEESGSAPMYIKSSQRRFIQEIGDDQKYNLVRIGLKDVEIYDWDRGEKTLSDILIKEINENVEEFFKDYENIQKFVDHIISFRLQASELFN